MNGIHYASRKKIFLIHGWALDSSVWNSFRLCLPMDWSINTIDLPGYGKQPQVSAACDVDSIVDCIINEVPSGAVLVGWSLGGLIAIRVAKRISTELNMLVLMASTPCFIEKKDWPHGVNKAQLLETENRLNDDCASAIQAFISETALGDITPQSTIKNLREITNGNLPDSSVLKCGLKILNELDLRADLKNLDCRLAMILGVNDHLVANSTGAATQSISPLISLINIDHAGHAPFISQCEATSRALIKLLG